MFVYVPLDKNIFTLKIYNCNKDFVDENKANYSIMQMIFTNKNNNKKDQNDDAKAYFHVIDNVNVLPPCTNIPSTERHG